MSIAMATTVFIREMALAPELSAALAVRVISVTLGESLAMTGRVVALRTAPITSLVVAGSIPKAIPPFLTLGQEMLTSIPLTVFSLLNCLASSAYSSTVSPAMLTMAGISSFARKGSAVFKKASNPSFCRPIELIMPEGVSTIRGGGFPSLAIRVTLLVMIPPSLFRSKKSAYSLP